MDAKYGIILISVVGVALATFCSEAERQANLDQCLEKIGEAGFKTDLFWFGTDYDSNCPSGPTTVDCANPRPQSTKRSLFTRLFPDGYNPTEMDRYLKMVFSTPPGEYSGCGNTYTVNTTWSQEIDPLSDLAVPNWYARLAPQLEWEANSTELFTLLVFDVGYLYTHAVYVNIQGNNFIGVTGDQIIKAYHGPQRTSTLKNPYAFLLFKQSGQVTVSEEWKQRLLRGAPDSFTQLKTDLGLTGPVAINWLLATGDVYGAQIMKDLGIINMCANFVAENLNVRPRPFLPTSPVFSVDVQVRFDVSPLDFTACCSTHTYTQESFNLNPLGNPIYDTYKTSPTPTVTLTKKGYIQQATNFTGEMYTLIAVDPDVPAATVGSQQRPLLHWLVYNIPGGNVNSGVQYQTYRGPTPPDRIPHFYYFLLYKQDSSLSSNTFLPYSGSCSGSIVGRCLFDINSLVANRNLTLVGASWMRATTDIYVAKRKIDGGDDVNTWCQGMPGYHGDPSCPVGASSHLLSSLVLIFLSFVLLMS